MTDATPHDKFRHVASFYLIFCTGESRPVRATLNRYFS